MLKRDAGFIRELIAACLLVQVVTLVGAGSPLSYAQEPPCRAFTTGNSVCGRFLQYWDEHGGLPQQGYPISGEMQEVSEVDGKSYRVQYFERAVFEHHPENRPPYDVLLSLLGALEYGRKYPGGAPGQQPNTSTGSILFPETGKRLGGRFLEYWQQNGGLMQQGYPISEEFIERSDLDGKEYRVQYFERAVFELHPENRPPYDVLLSQLGTFQYRRKRLGGTGTATPMPTPSPQPLNVISTNLPDHPSHVISIAWSPDGGLLAAGLGREDAGSTDYALRLWRADGTLAATPPGHTDSVHSIAWSPDGKMLASGSGDGTVRLWTRGGVPSGTLQMYGGTVFAVSWSPDGETLASGTVFSPSRSAVQLWRPDGTLVRTLSTLYNGGKFYNLAWSPDGSLLLGGAIDHKLWRRDGTEVYHRQACSQCTPAWAMVWSPNSRAWAIGNESGEVFVYDTAGNRTATMQHRHSVNALAWSPDGTILAGGDAVGMWRRDGTLITNLRGDAGGVDSVAWSPDGKMLASGDTNGIVRLWNSERSPFARLEGGSTVPRTTWTRTALAWSPDGKTLASGSGRVITLWKVRD